MFRTTKYHAKKVTVDGETFDSRLEWRRWCVLRLLEKAGEICDLKRQVEFVLIPAQYDGGKCVERAVKYVADFTYYGKNLKLVVEDTKGVRTPEYIIKRKLMLFRHGIKIQEINK